MLNPKFLVGALSLALLCECSGNYVNPGSSAQTPQDPQDPQVAQVSQAILSPTQNNLTVSGVFRQAKWGKNAQTAVLVTDTNFFGSSGIIQAKANAGYQLVDVDIDTSTGQRLYSAVFESGVPGTQYWELQPSDFLNKVSALDLQGIRLISLHTYVSTGGTLFYSGVFQQGPDPQVYPGDLSWTDFTHKIDALSPTGYFLTNLAVFVSGGQERYLGVWRYHPESTTRSAFWVSEWNSFAKQDQWENALGLRLVSMAHWEFNGDRKYGGVWLEGNDAYDVVAATDSSVYSRKVGELAAASKVPIRITIERGYQPPVGLAAAFNDELDSEAVGYSYAISEKGALTAKGAFGYARAPWEASNIYPNNPMSLWTRMDIASVTKAVAATAIFKLLESSTRTCTSGTCTASNFGLDTPIGSIRTGYTFGQYVSGVTVRMLVNMTSNLYEASCDKTYGSDLPSYTTCVLDNCTKAWVTPAGGGNPTQNATDPCVAPSGQFNYNGADPTILRVVIEKLTGLTFEQYVHNTLFLPAGIDFSSSNPTTDLSNANCDPDLSTNPWVPLYYHAGDGSTHGTGIIEANSYARSEKVCGAGAMQMAVWQMDLFARGLMTGINGGSPFLPTPGDLNTMLSAGMFGGQSSYPGLGQTFAKNGGFDMGSGGKGMASAIVMATNLNTQLSTIVNTQGTDSATNLGPNMPAGLVNGLVRMTTKPLGVYSIRNRNNGSMCLNVYGGALSDSKSGGGNVPIIEWSCGSPVANNMLFVKLDVGESDPGTGAPYFMLQSVNSGHCITDFGDIRQWDCDGTDSQLFSYSDSGGGYGHIIAKASGQCLDVSGGSLSSGTNIVQTPCGSALQPDFQLQSNVGPDSGSPFGVPSLFWPNDNGVTTSDWAYGSAKGQCAPGQPVTGLSQALDQSHAESVLCETYPGNSTTYPQNSCRTLWFSVGVNPPNNNPANWPWGANFPDWDPWYYKAQCNPNEYVAGVAQNLSGQVDAIMCCVGNVTAASCEDSTNAEVFYNNDSHSRIASGGVDWDWGYYKGQCPAGEYVQGVSAVLSGTGQRAGAAHALRCCSP